ncbi:MAG: transglutaminase-like domain-containing protein [Candidatus Omnitrophica bacterium]|nr:transglutaminase-like domain-containing protein [Candidatus Omnitrophota bacterium]
MRFNAFMRLFLIVLIWNQVLVSQESPRWTRTLKILRMGVFEGKIIENIKETVNNIYYEKKLINKKGEEEIHFKFVIEKDFSFTRGKIKKKGESFSIRTGKTYKIGKKSYSLPKNVLPSSIVHLYTHRKLKKGEKLASNLNVFYENTMDIFEMRIENFNKNNYVDIFYMVDKLNLRIREIYFYDEDIYCLILGQVLIFDERLENKLILGLLTNKDERSNRVIVHPQFDGFSKGDFIIYKLTFSESFSLPEDYRQKIINKFQDKNSAMYIIKILKNYQKNYPLGNYKCSSSDFFIKKSAAITKLTQNILKGSKEEKEKIQRIIGWIKWNIKPSQEENFEPEIVLNKKKADCQGITNLFLAMCSVLNIPGRRVVGIVLNKQKNNFVYSFHQWVELCLNGNWVPLDPTIGSTEVGLNYIKLANIERNIDYLKLISALNLKLEIIMDPIYEICHYPDCLFFYKNIDKNKYHNFIYEESL